MALRHVQQAFWQLQLENELNFQMFNPFPTLVNCGLLGSATLYRSPLGVPGTGLRVCGGWYGHKEDICGRSFNELNVIHTR